MIWLFLLALTAAVSRAEQGPDDLEELDSLSFPAFVAGPIGAPAVIVVQEWWGVTDQIKSHAKRISEIGFRVLVPDLYKGEVGVDKEEASHLMGQLDFDVAVQEIGQAAEHLHREGSPKIGITGFCMGGALALGGLAASERIVAAAPFYGINRPTMMAGSGKLNGLFDPVVVKHKSVQGHFGKLDGFEGFSDPKTARELERALQAAGNTDAVVYLYDDVGHAFMNDSPAPYKSFAEREEALGMPPYREDVAELAWGRVLAFFSSRLKLDFNPRVPPSLSGSACPSPSPPHPPPPPYPPRLPRLLKHDYSTESLPVFTPFEATAPPPAAEGASSRHSEEDELHSSDGVSVEERNVRFALLGGGIAGGATLTAAFGLWSVRRFRQGRAAAAASAEVASPGVPLAMNRMSQ